MKKIRSLKKLNNYQVLLGIICLSFAILIFCVEVAALFQKSKQSEVAGVSGTFEVQPVVSFGGEYTILTGNELAVDVLDASDSKFFGNFKMNVEFRGQGKYYLRVAIFEQWMKQKPGGDWVYDRHVITRYNFAGVNWFDYRKMDNYIYYKLPIDGNSSGFEVLEFITGLTDAVSVVNMQMSMYIMVEAVQFNRADEIWGFAKLPWEEQAP